MDGLGQKILKRQHQIVEEASDMAGWKKQHDDAMMVIELESVFRQVVVAVETIFALDNQIHERVASEDNPKWFPAYMRDIKKFFLLAKGGIATIEKMGISMKASAYRNATLTPDNVAALRERIEGALETVEEHAKCSAR